MEFIIKKRGVPASDGNVTITIDKGKIGFVEGKYLGLRLFFYSIKSIIFFKFYIYFFYILYIRIGCYLYEYLSFDIFRWLVDLSCYRIAGKVEIIRG